MGSNAHNKAPLTKGAMKTVPQARNQNAQSNVQVSSANAMGGMASYTMNSGVSGMSNPGTCYFTFHVYLQDRNIGNRINKSDKYKW